MLPAKVSCCPAISSTGGAGVDTLLLANGISLPAGVTLTSIEFVIYS